MDTPKPIPTPNTSPTPTPPPVLHQLPIAPPSPWSTKNLPSAQEKQDLFTVDETEDSRLTFPAKIVAITITLITFMTAAVYLLLKSFGITLI
jgi:hypothetical protein